MNDFLAFQQHHQAPLQAALLAGLPPSDQIPAKLKQALQYVVNAPAKRIRPLLLYATAHSLQLDIQHLQAAAVALEYIHCYSLVHDDLPAMDDDDLRRGQPTVHKAFDEATAILVGDALQALAFEQLAKVYTGPGLAKAVLHLAQAAGTEGMIAGQMLDLGPACTKVEELDQLHRLKTGALIQASVQLALILCEPQPAAINTALHDYAVAIGLAFQIKDDILDVEGNTEQLGKTQGIDSVNGKCNYVMMMGLTEAKARCNTLIDNAKTALQALPKGAPLLQAIADFIMTRNH